MNSSMYLSYKTRNNAPVEGRRKVFISYKKADDKQSHFRDLIIDKTLEAVDCAVWYDSYLTPGVNYDVEIENAITSCDAIVLLLSKEILHSTYVWEVEIKTAQKQKKPVIPIAFDISTADLNTVCEKLSSNIEVLKYLVNGEYIPGSDFDNAYKRSLLIYVVNADLASRIERFFLSGRDKTPYIYLTPEDRYLMGVGYLRGIGTDRDTEKGIRLLDSIANIDAEDDESKKLVGEAALKLTEHFNGVPDKERAFAYAVIGSRADNLECMEYEGLAYEKGEGTEADLEKARSIYERASAAGSNHASYQLGLFFMEGRGVPKDIGKAVGYFGRGAMNGDSYCMVTLGKIYESVGEYSKAYLWYREGSNHGNPDAIYGLGYLSLKGLGTPKDPAFARKCFEVAAQRGVSEAKQTLMVLDFSENLFQRTRPDHTAPVLATEERENTDDGSKQNDAAPQDLSLTELKEAAEHGNAAAMNELGLRYFTGTGGAEKDIKEAFRWTEEAAKAGNNVSAMFRMASLYLSGAVPVDIEKALYWAEQARLHHHPMADVLFQAIEKIKESQ